MKIVGTENTCIKTQKYGDLTMRVVLVEGEAKDIAAYIGCGHPQWVAEHGNKVPFDAVNQYFPGFERQIAELGLTYRH